MGEKDIGWTLEEELGNKNISIGFINSAYIEINEIQDKDDEYKKIKKYCPKIHFRAVLYNKVSGISTYRPAQQRP